MEIKKAFIMAAGEGQRLRPYSKKIPKVLFSIHGETLLERHLKYLDAHLSPEIIYLVIGNLSEHIEEFVLKVEHKYKAKIDYIYIPADKIKGGLVEGVSSISGYLNTDEPFVSLLGDEYYDSQNYFDFFDHIRKKDFEICCAYKAFKQPDEYFRNYSVTISKNFEIKEVYEKPNVIKSPYFGLGLIVAKKSFSLLALDEVSKENPKNLYNLINYPISNKEKVIGVELKGLYVNMNSATDLYHILRNQRHSKTKSIDVIIPAWNEAESIEYVVKDFSPHCRNVIVMDNNSIDGTGEIAKAAGAVVYTEKLLGYGDAIKKGLDRSDADILIITEADGTFRADDLDKIISYLTNADAVIGSRTYWQYVEFGADMSFIQRMANIVYGLIITLLWYNRKSRFTDIGCSYRGIWRESYDKIKDNLIGHGPEFAPEMVIELLHNWQRVIEIPVPYHARVTGDSKFSGSFIQLSKTALKMLKMILKKRVSQWMNNFLEVFKGNK